MVKCEYCVYFDGKKCTNPRGRKYTEVIKNQFEDIDCNGYLDKGFAGAMAPDIDLFDMF